MPFDEPLTVVRFDELHMCTLAYPVQYERTAGENAALTVGLEANSISIPAEMSEGAVYEIALQGFPDGTCGIAVNGVPRVRSETSIGLDRPFRIVLQGNSYQTEILVANVSIWEGINPEYDWTVLDKEDEADNRR